MNKLKILTITFIMLSGAGTITYTTAQPVTTGTNPLIPVATQNIANGQDSTIKLQQPQKTYIMVDPVDMVNYPNRYMNKNVKFRAKFDKFATLGLDYKPAFRSSEKYISFLIQHSDITTHNVPLSELKIFLDRKEAEKHIDLDSGDEIEVSGHVFSNALGDVWMDAEQFIVVNKKTTANKY